MQRPVHRVAGTYRVNFSPEAWRLIGSMPSMTFQSLQRALERIADSPRRTGSEAPPELSATLDNLTIIYTLNDTERVLTVVNILRADSGKLP